MNTPQRDLSVTMIQMCSTTHIQDNHAQCCAAIKAVEAGSTDLITLPENMWYLRDPAQATAVAFDGTEQLFCDLQTLAQEKRCAIHLGSFPERIAGSSKVYNTSRIIHADGQLGPQYRKRHLFSLKTAREHLDENEYCVPGNEIVMDRVEGWNIGLSICYDLRFPEHYRHMATQGMDLALVPSAFTRTTGPAHWEPLLRARAIENQCFVIAAAQCGEHCSGRASYGHSLAIDPWGNIIGQCEEQPATITVSLSAQQLHTTRQQVPALQDHFL